MVKSLRITQPDDWHLHLRDGNKLARTVADSARQFKRALIMPNLLPPITSITQAEAYRKRILAAAPLHSNFNPLMTLYLTDDMPITTIDQAAEHPHIIAAKLYPAHTTTNTTGGVTKIQKIYALLEAMQYHGFVLCIHGEVPYGDIFDREKRFIDTVLIPLCTDFPQLKIVLEHITTKEAVDFVRDSTHPIGATITPQHLLYNRSELLAGGIKPHLYCLPILKRESHRQALLQAAISGNKKFFLGTDSAPHSINDKHNACGCAGVYSAHSAIELYAKAFMTMQALDKLEAFASFHGADFYGLPRNQCQIKLTEKTWQVPQSLAFGTTTVIPLAAGERLSWQLQQR